MTNPIISTVENGRVRPMTKDEIDNLLLKKEEEDGYVIDFNYLNNYDSK